MTRTQNFLRALSIPGGNPDIPLLWTDLLFLVNLFPLPKTGWLAALGVLGKLIVGLPLLDRGLWEKAYSKSYDWGFGNPEEIRKKQTPIRWELILRGMWVIEGLVSLIALLLR